MDVGEIVTKPVFFWEVNPDHFQGKRAGEFLLSPIFYTDNGSEKSKKKWQLVLFPNGYDTETEGFISLWVRNLNKDMIVITYSLSILNEFNEKIDSTPYVRNAHVPTKLYHGYKKIGPENFLTENNHKKLRLMCHIILKKDVNEPEVGIKKSWNEFNLVDDFEKILNDYEFSDVTVTSADGKNFSLHKIILAARSIVFDKMFRNNMREKNQNAVVIEDVRAEVLKELFRFLYTGQVSDNTENIVCELLTAAEKYCIESLKTVCEEIMESKLCNENAIDYLNLAFLNNAKKLESDAISYMSSHKDDFVDNPEFIKLGFQQPKVLFEMIKKLKKA